MATMKRAEEIKELLAPQQKSMTARGTDLDPDKPVQYELDPDPVIDTSCPGCFQVSCLGNLVSLVFLPFSMLACFGVRIVSEKQHYAVLFFGNYSGSIQTPGIHWLPPFGAELRLVSTATQTMNMNDIKVLDSKGNPVVISAVVTFEPTSAKKACIDVQNPFPSRTSYLQVASPYPEGTTPRPVETNQDNSFLQLQAKAVLKQVTSMFPYEAPMGVPSLQTEGVHIADMLIARLQERVAVAGARILSFDLVDLSYAPEIASAMLVRQQAAALVDARSFIVKAAVDMATYAVTDLEAKTGQPLSTEMRERVCTNLLTVICSSEAVTPTVNMG